MPRPETRMRGVFFFSRRVARFSSRSSVHSVVIVYSPHSTHGLRRPYLFFHDILFLTLCPEEVVLARL